MLSTFGLIWACQSSLNHQTLDVQLESKSTSLTSGSPINPKIPLMKQMMEAIVYIEYTVQNKNIQTVNSCNGVIVGPFKVLTAAHCFFDSELSLQKQPKPMITQLKIQYGDTTANSNLIKQIKSNQILSIDIHQNYLADQIRKKNTPESALNDSVLNGSDQAIITLNHHELLQTEHFDFFKSIPNFYQLDNGSFDKRTVHQFDFSLLFSYSSYLDFKTQKLAQPTLYGAPGSIPTRILEFASNEPAVIIDTLVHFQSRQQGIGTCAGDSGAPLLYKIKNSDKFLLVGIVSGGLESASSGQNCSFETIFSLVKNGQNGLSY